MLRNETHAKTRDEFVKKKKNMYNTNLLYEKDD